MAQTAIYDTIRTLANGSITTSLGAIGGPLLYPARIFKIVNNTDGDLFISTDGINNQDFLPAKSFVLYDLCTNRLNSDQMFLMPGNTQFYAAYSTAPTTGSVYVVVLKGIPQ